MKIFAVIFGLLSMICQTVLAEDTDKTLDHSTHIGVKVHESDVKDYHFAYHLVDLKKGATRHLMVYIMDHKMKEIDKAKVGFLIQGPDGKKQKLMAVGMKGAFGADVNLKTKGTYLIKMKVIAGENTLIDNFEYKVD
ncbi:hypothetical protein ACFL9T_06415 [Thermodesulfobacteriota bacterium]